MLCRPKIGHNGWRLHIVLTEGKNYFETEDVRSSSGLRTTREAAIRCYGSPKGFRSIALALGAVADFGALNCQYTTKFDAR
jgi:hypothetical protein